VIRIRRLPLALAAPLVFVVVQFLPTPALVASAQPLVGQETISGGLRVVLVSDLKTGQRYIQLAGRSTPTYPTIDVMCDGKRWTVPLTRSDDGSVYEISRTIAEGMLAAIACRMFLPDQEIALARAQLWAAWVNHSRGSEAPAIFVGQVLDVVTSGSIRKRSTSPPRVPKRAGVKPRRRIDNWSRASRSVSSWTRRSETVKDGSWLMST